jgi:predicted GTPase
MRDRRYRLWLGASLVLGCTPLCGAESEGLQCTELLQIAGRVQSRDAVELPTIVLVGHKNDGKSSLFEALLGLKLTHVGHDATTRRPLRVHAQYDETAAEPALYLVRNGQEESMRLEDIYAYLQSENARLEEAGTYEAEPVHVRLLWKRATTCVLIDTPGLIGDTQSEELGTLKGYVEQIVAEQIKPAKRLILCLEDTSDWALVRTMGAVAQVDPELKRTILVATKLDAKMAQVPRAHFALRVRC